MVMLGWELGKEEGSTPGRWGPYHPRAGWWLRGEDADGAANTDWLV